MKKFTIAIIAFCVIVIGIVMYPVSRTCSSKTIFNVVDPYTKKMNIYNGLPVDREVKVTTLIKTSKYINHIKVEKMFIDKKNVIQTIKTGKEITYTHLMNEVSPKVTKGTIIKEDLCRYLGLTSSKPDGSGDYLDGLYKIDAEIKYKVNKLNKVYLAYALITYDIDTVSYKGKGKAQLPVGYYVE